MQKQINQIKEFNKAFNDFEQEKPTSKIPEKYKELRKKLLQEEVIEVIKAIDNNDIYNLAHELADLLYVLLGTVTTFGLGQKFENVFNEIHKSNMSKLDSSGKPVLDVNGKAIKSEFYTKPDIKKILDSESQDHYSFDYIHQKAISFAKDRNWFPLAPEDLAKSIMIEGAELLEHFQWDATNTKYSKGDGISKDDNEIKLELADVLIYCIYFAKNMDWDLAQIINQKLLKQEIKYPLEKFKNGQNDEFYRSQKQKYRNNRKKE